MRWGVLRYPTRTEANASWRYEMSLRQATSQLPTLFALGTILLLFFLA